MTNEAYSLLQLNSLYLYRYIISQLFSFFNSLSAFFDKIITIFYHFINCEKLQISQITKKELSHRLNSFL